SAHMIAADSLVLHELRIVDSTGAVRVHMSADMPHAAIGGRRLHRPERAAGVMLYDDTGQERTFGRRRGPRTV
ncbi:MAG TPA: hypothetical protein VGM50_19695, partial [Gemmatimonadaceae bacterium]